MSKGPDEETEIGIWLIIGFGMLLGVILLVTLVSDPVAPSSRDFDVRPLTDTTDG